LENVRDEIDRKSKDRIINIKNKKFLKEVLKRLGYIEWKFGDEMRDTYLHRLKRFLSNGLC